MNKYVIWYCNSHAKDGTRGKILCDVGGERVIIKARTKKEANKKAYKQLKTTGMLYEVEKLT